MTEVFKVDGLATEFRFHLFSLSKITFIKKYQTFEIFIACSIENDVFIYFYYYYSLKHALYIKNAIGSFVLAAY